MSLAIFLCVFAAFSVFALHSCFLEQVGGSVSLSVMDYLPSSLYTPPQAAVWWPALNDALITAAVAKGALGRRCCAHTDTLTRAPHTQSGSLLCLLTVCLCAGSTVRVLISKWAHTNARISPALAALEAAASSICSAPNAPTCLLQRITEALLSESLTLLS